MYTIKTKENGYNAEQYIIQKLQEEFQGEHLDINYKQSRGIDLEVHNCKYHFNMEIKSCERDIYWTPKKNPKKTYRKDGGFEIKNHQLDYDVFAFVIKEKNGFSHYYVNGIKVREFVRPKITGKFYRLYHNKIRLLSPKTKIKELLDGRKK